MPTGILVPLDLAETYDGLLDRVREIGDTARDELAAIVDDEERFNGDNRTAIRDSAIQLLREQSEPAASGTA